MLTLPSKANDKIAIKNGDIFCKNPRAKLEPLRHVGNGKSVPEFPATLAELRLLKGRFIIILRYLPCAVNHALPRRLVPWYHLDLTDTFVQMAI